MTTSSKGGFRRSTLFALLLASGLAPALGRAQGEVPINPPLGPYVHLNDQHFAGVPSYSLTNRLVLTPYFYWYDVTTSAHIVNGDGSDALTDHPPTLDDFSFRSTTWHATQLRDMIAAGIDILLPVYWGAPSERVPNQPVSAQPWSYSGLPPLVAARRALVAEGLEPPRIGMFYDTSTLQYNRNGERIDLTTPYGRQWFYESIRDFFSLIPPEHWAMIDGQPVIFLYSAGFASHHDQSSIDYLRTAFARDFGGRIPYIVREISWNVATENVYAWGGALGLKNPGVASLGPGYDHSAVPGREPLVVDREGGAFFERNWINFLRRPSNLVFVETWNELHEGTEIAETREYGRQYIELNRHFVELFRKGVVPPRPRGPYSDFKRIHVDLAETNTTHGLYQVESADGATEPAEVGGSACRAAKATAYAGRYIYFRVDDSFKWADRMLVEVQVEYFDHPGGQFTLEFDGSDTNAPFAGAYSPTRRTIFLRGSATWKTATFRLAGARFLNSQNAGTDFRLALQAETFHVRRVEVIRLGLPEEAGAILPGRQPALDESWPSDWKVTGNPAAVTRLVTGGLQLNGDENPPQLLLPTPPSTGAGQEVLVRLRIRRPPADGASLGGLVIAPLEGGEPQVRLDFYSGATPGFHLQVTPAGQEMFAPYPWRPNTWYWLRLRHATNRITGYPDLWARLWPADGETLEPAAWPLYLDYHPQLPVIQGSFGLHGSATPGTVLETDFFLVKAEEAAAITVVLPRRQPAWLELHAPSFSPASGDFQLTLEGAPNQTYALEHSDDFGQWTGNLLQTDTQGTATWTDAESPFAPRQFYRARAQN